METKLRTAVAVAERVVSIAGIALTTVLQDEQTRGVMADQLADLQDVVASAKRKLERGVTPSDVEIMTEFLIGTVQAVIGRMISSECGNISIVIGVEGSA